MRSHVVDPSEEPATGHIVGVPRQHRCHQGSQLLGRVLAVGVAEGDGRGSPLDRGRQPHPHCRAQAAILAQADHLRARSPGPRRSGVGRAVVDHEHIDGPAQHFCRCPPYAAAHRLLLVVRRHEEHHWSVAGHPNWHGRPTGRQFNRLGRVNRLRSAPQPEPTGEAGCGDEQSDRAGAKRVCGLEGVGGQRGHQRIARLMAEGDVGRDRGRLVGPESAGSDRRHLSGDRDRGDAHCLRGGDLQSGPLRGLPYEHRFAQPGHDRQTQRSRARQPNVGALPGQPVQPQPSRQRGCGHTGKHEPAAPTSQTGQRGRACHQAQSHHGQQVGRAQGDHRGGGRVQARSGSADHADDSHRLAQAQREQVIAAQGQVDPAQGVAEAQAWEYSAPSRRPKQERHAERCHRREDPNRLASSCPGGLGERLAVHRRPDHGDRQGGNR